MMRLVRVGFAAAFLLLPASMALAQPNALPARDADLEDFMQAPAYRTFVEDTVNAIEPEPLRAECQRMTIVGPVDSYFPLVKSAVTGEAPNKRLAKGAWISIVEFDRCGKKTKRRTFMQIDPKGSILPLRLLPGEFRGNPILERDAVGIVFPALMISSGCKDSKQVHVADIAVRETEPGYDWSETWTALGCGTRVDLGVYYSTKSDGTTITTQNIPRPQ